VPLYAQRASVQDYQKRASTRKATRHRLPAGEDARPPIKSTQPLPTTEVESLTKFTADCPKKRSVDMNDQCSATRLEHPERVLHHLAADGIEYGVATAQALDFGRGQRLRQSRCFRLESTQ